MAKDNMHGYHPSSDLADATALAPADVAAAFAKVHTARLTLRRLRPRDGAAVFAVHSDPTTNRDTSAGSDPDRAASNARLRSWLRRWETDGYSIWVVTRLQARRVEEILGWGDPPPLARPRGPYSVLPIRASRVGPGLCD